MIGEFYMLNARIKKLMRKSISEKIPLTLDIGCGETPYYHRLINGKVVAFDICRCKNTSVIGDADFLPFKDDSFDLLISVNSLYYFKNPLNVIELANKVLKKNGKILIIVPFFYPIHDAPIDRYRFTEYGIRTMLEQHFRVSKLECVGGFVSLPSVILHALIKGIPLFAPKSLKKTARFFSYILFYIPYIISQLFSSLDFLDRTRRWPTYYFVTA